MATDQNLPFEELDLAALDPEARHDAIRANLFVSFGRALGVSDETMLAAIAALDAGHDFDIADFERLKNSAEADGMEVDVSFEEIAETAATTAELDNSAHYKRAVNEHNRSRDLSELRRTRDRLHAIRAVTRKRVRRSRSARRSTTVPRRRPPIVSTDCSTRDSSSSRSSGTDPGTEDSEDPEPERATGPGALCHCGCGKILPASKRSHAKWWHPENCRNRFARNAPKQSEPRRDTRVPDAILKDIEVAVAARATLLRITSGCHRNGDPWDYPPSGWRQLNADHRRHLETTEKELNGKGGLWQGLREARAARAALEPHSREVAGAPSLRQPSLNYDAGSGNGTGDSDHKRKPRFHLYGEDPGASRADRRRAQAARSLRESGRTSVAEDIEAWRRRNGRNVAALPTSRRQPRQAVAA